MPRSSPRLVLAAMIFAVAMMFIEQTIVTLAIPDLQKDLSLSATADTVDRQRLPAVAGGPAAI